MKVVSLDWDVSNGTETYTVSAETGDTVITLSTNITTALFSDFVCGQNYNLKVTPVNQYCPSNQSASTSIQTCAYQSDMAIGGKICRIDSKHIRSNE